MKYAKEKYRQCTMFNRSVLFRFVVFNATFNNISVISWRTVLLVEESGVPGENHRPVAIYRQTSSQSDALITPHHERGSNSQL
jgi:hypothetical protein